MDHQHGPPSACVTSQQPTLPMVVQLWGTFLTKQRGVPGCEQIHGKDFF